MLSVTGTWELHLKQIDLLREGMNKCLNQRQKKTKWLKWSKNALSSHFRLACCLIVLQSELLTPLAGELMYSPAHGYSPLNTRAPWARLLLPPPATPPWLLTVSWLTYVTTMDGLPQSRHWAPSGMVCMEKICQQLSSGRIFPLIFHRIVQLWELRPTSEPELPPLTNGSPSHIVLGTWRDYFKAFGYDVSENHKKTIKDKLIACWQFQKYLRVATLQKSLKCPKILYSYMKETW